MCYFIVGRHEIKVLTHAAYLRGIFVSTMVFSERTSLFVTLICYSFMGHHISADKVITSYSHVQCCVSNTEVFFFVFDCLLWRWCMPCHMKMSIQMYVFSLQIYWYISSCRWNTHFYEALYVLISCQFTFFLVGTLTWLF
jgi:hypothetical protein